MDLHNLARRAECLSAAALLVFLLGSPLRADVLTTTEGKVLEGRVLERTSGGVRFEVVSGGVRGVFFFPNSRIAKLEEGPGPGEKLRRAYQEQRRKLDLTTAKGWYRLGEWCLERKMYEEAADAFRRSAEQDRAYLVRARLAEARVEVARGRLRTARNILADLLKTHPDEPAVENELARVQRAIDEELMGLFARGRRAYDRGDFPTALPLLRRVALEADAQLLTRIAKQLAAEKHPSLAEMLVDCRLADRVVDRPEAFRKVTPLERGLLLGRLRTMVEGGVRSAGAARSAIAARFSSADPDEISAAVEREVSSLERLARLARVGGELAKEDDDDTAGARFARLAGRLVQARVELLLLWGEYLVGQARKALAVLGESSASFSRRLRAGEGADKRLDEVLEMLKGAGAAGSASPEVLARIRSLQRELADLRRRIRDLRDHILRIRTALDRALKAYRLRRFDDAVLWFDRLVREANPEEGRFVEAEALRRTGEDLVDLIVDSRIRLAYREGRFRKARSYERAALERELQRRSTRADEGATRALAEARAAPPGSKQRSAACHRAIDLAQEAIFLLRGFFEIGLDLSRAERRRIREDIDRMQEVVHQARKLLAEPPPAPSSR